MLSNSLTKATQVKPTPKMSSSPTSLRFNMKYEKIANLQGLASHSSR